MLGEKDQVTGWDLLPRRSTRTRKAQLCLGLSWDVSGFIFGLVQGPPHSCFQGLSVYMRS